MRTEIPEHLKLKQSDLKANARQTALLEKKLRQPVEFYQKLVRESFQRNPLEPEDRAIILEDIRELLADIDVTDNEVRPDMEHLEKKLACEPTEAELEKTITDRAKDISSQFSQWWLGTLWHCKDYGKKKAGQLRLDDKLCPNLTKAEVKQLGSSLNQLSGYVCVPDEVALIELLKANALYVSKRIAKGGKFVVFNSPSITLIIRKDENGYYLE